MFRITDAAARRLRWTGGGLLALIVLGIALFWHKLIDQPVAVLVMLIPISTVGVMCAFLGFLAGHANSIHSAIGGLAADVEQNSHHLQWMRNAIEGGKPRPTPRQNGTVLPEDEYMHDVAEAYRLGKQTHRPPDELV